jgi:NAD(P)-dependent dehydrogenase (short-subunit alcohol dehydrogenase family)
MSPQANPRSLEGQAVLVTGGGRGIGRETALTLVAAGARVAVMARSSDQTHKTAEMIRKAGGSAEAFTADVRDSEAVENAVRFIEESLGTVEVLINNAGTVKPFGPLWRSSSRTCIR